MLTSNDLNIVRNLTIRGPVTHPISLSSGSSGHMIHVLAGFSVAIFNLDFKDSKVSPSLTTGFILNEGTLTLSNSTVSGNTSGGGGNSAGVGGGISSLSIIRRMSESIVLVWSFRSGVKSNTTALLTGIR